MRESVYTLNDFYPNDRIIDCNDIEWVVKGLFEDYLLCQEPFKHGKYLKVYYEEIKAKKGGGVKAERKTVTLPWDEPEFAEAWRHWKAYRLKLDGFTYKYPKTEQGALTQLYNKAEGQLTIAFAIISQSISNNWRGLFKLEN